MSAVKWLSVNVTLLEVRLLIELVAEAQCGDVTQQQVRRLEALQRKLLTALNKELLP